MQTITFIRGLPGSGKSTLAKKMRADSHSAATIVEVEQYFTDVHGNYIFDSNKSERAEMWAQEQMLDALMSEHDVIVANNFCKLWQIQEYARRCHPFIGLGWRFVLIDLYDGGVWISGCADRNIHGVTYGTISHMAHNWEPISVKQLY